jgi:stage V sporulation protein G
MKHKITEVQIFTCKYNNGLLGFAKCVIDDDLYLGSIAIYSKLDGTGYRLKFPNKKVGDNMINLYHPINKDFAKQLEDAIVDKYKEIIKDNL